MLSLKKLWFKIIRVYYLKFNPKKYLSYIGVKYGNDCRLISITSSTFGSEPYLITLGDKVTITKNVQFLTHDGSLDLFREQHPDIEYFGNISVGNKVFIGYSSIILPGTTIGDNVIIGAGSVVKGTVRSDSVYAGVPAKRICSVSEYYDKNHDSFTSTKHLDPETKRRFLENR